MPHLPGFAADTVNPWQELGPAPLSPPGQTPNSGLLTGRLRAIAIHPTDPKTIYVGAAQGGVWKTTDGGSHFTPLTDEQPSLAMGALAIDPKAPETVYAGTGENNFGYYGQGLLKSIDGGKSWTRPAGTMFAGASTSKIVIDSRSGFLYLATSAGSQGAGDGCTAYHVDKTQLGLWRSTDGGMTFERLAEGGVTDFEIDGSVTPRQIFLSVSGLGAFSLTEGGSLQPLALPSASTNPPGNEIQLALAPSNPKVLYAGVAVGARGMTRAVLYVSQDHGQTFAPVANSPDYCYSQCGYTNVVEVHPTDPNTVYLGGGLCSVWRTTNGLSPSPTFRAVSMPQGYCAPGFANWYEHYVHPDAHALAFLPGNGQSFLVGTDGGLSMTTDGGTVWSDLNQSLRVIQFYGLCVDPDDPAHLFGGAQDNGSMERSGTPPTWTGLITGDGGPCLANALSDGVKHYVITDTNAAVRVPGGAQFDTTFDANRQFCQPGDPGCGDRSSFVAPLAIDPSAPANLYIGTYRLWQSTNGGALGSWTSISDDLTFGPVGNRCVAGGESYDYLTAIAVAPSAGKTLYTGSAGGKLSRTTDGGATWTTLSASNLPRRWVSAIGVDPASPDVVWVAFSGFNANTLGQPGHVFRSMDGGKSWSARDIGMDMPVNSLLVRPDAGNVLFVGTDFGVLTTTDGGATWIPEAGLPNVTVYSLQFHDKSGTLYAGTHGRGAWSRKLVPTVAAQPASLMFTATFGANPQVLQSATVTVGNGDSSGSLLHFTATSSDGWLAATPTSGQATSASGVPIAITAIPPGPIGEYQATLTVADPASANGVVSIPVHFSVTAPPRGCGCQLGQPTPGRASLLGLLFAFAVLSGRRRGKRGG